MPRGYAIPGGKLDLERAVRGWTVTEMAEKSGISIAVISRALNGKPISVETMRLLTAALLRYPELPGLRALLTDDG